MERQQVLGRAYLTAIIDAHVLQRCIGSRAIMAEQCAHLLTMAERPGYRVARGAGRYERRIVGRVRHRGRDGMATVNLTTIRDVTSTASDLVDEAMQAYERILGAALPRAESLDFVRTQEDQWKTQI